jgi:hypothetical protein
LIPAIWCWRRCLPTSRTTAPHDEQRFGLSHPRHAPPGPRPRLEEEEIPSVRRRREDDPPVRRRRPKLRRESARGPSVTFESGWFGSFNGGVIGGLLMILIAGVWFVLGLSFGRIFFYPIFLVIAGIVSIVKGIAGN